MLNAQKYLKGNFPKKEEVNDEKIVLDWRGKNLSGQVSFYGYGNKENRNQFTVLIDRNPNLEEIYFSEGLTIVRNNANECLIKKYPLKERSRVRIFSLNHYRLNGSLEIVAFKNLKEIFLFENFLQEIILKNCPNLVSITLNASELENLVINVPQQVTLTFYDSKIYLENLFNLPSQKIREFNPGKGLENYLKNFRGKSSKEINNKLLLEEYQKYIRNLITEWQGEKLALITLIKRKALPSELILLIEKNLKVEKTLSGFKTESLIKQGDKLKKEEKFFLSFYLIKENYFGNNKIWEKNKEETMIRSYYQKN